MTREIQKQICAYCNGNHNRRDCLHWLKDTIAKLESENARLKALLVDVWNYLNAQTPPDGWWQYEDHLKLESQLRAEGII
ncbi:MAG: hypothetical protein Q7J98_07105 [Kiritimatiellia bacterium]|nr:hypothetical protein [Kiritimatiellia bacterium]